MAQQTIAKVEGPLPWTHKASGSVNHDFKLRFEGSDDKFVITQKPTSAVPQIGQQIDVETLGPHPMHEGFTKVKRSQQQQFQQTNGTPSHDATTQRSIEAQVSLKCAVEYHARDEKAPIDVVQTAAIFADWLGGRS